MSTEAVTECALVDFEFLCDKVLCSD